MDGRAAAALNAFAGCGPMFSPSFGRSGLLTKYGSDDAVCADHGDDYHQRDARAPELAPLHIYTSFLNFADWLRDIPHCLQSSHQMSQQYLSARFGRQSIQIKQSRGLVGVAGGLRSEFGIHQSSWDSRATPLESNAINAARTIVALSVSTIRQKGASVFHHMIWTCPKTRSGNGICSRVNIALRGSETNGAA